MKALLFAAAAALVVALPVDAQQQGVSSDTITIGGHLLITSAQLLGSAGDDTITLNSSELTGYVTMLGGLGHDTLKVDRLGSLLTQHDRGQGLVRDTVDLDGGDVGLQIAEAAVRRGEIVCRRPGRQRHRPRRGADVLA